MASVAVSVCDFAIVFKLTDIHPEREQVPYGKYVSQLSHLVSIVSSVSSVLIASFISMYQLHVEIIFWYILVFKLYGA
jgi:hypothetical protein